MEQPHIVFPGSFDPVTNGHMDIIERGARLAARLTVLILINSRKTSLFTGEEKKELLELSIQERRHRKTGDANEAAGSQALERVRVEFFEGLTADWCRRNKGQALVRGLRGMMDLDYEEPISLINDKMFPGLETVFLVSRPEHRHISSSVVREMARYRQPVLSGLVPGPVVEPLLKKLN